jgi:general stress protein YciG
VAHRLQPECFVKHGDRRGDPGKSESGWEDAVAKEDRGFASMDRNKQREIASKGGKAAHQKGTAHEWTSEEAREAGRKGGMASHRRKQQQQSGDGSPEEPQDESGGEQMIGSEDLR